MSTHLGIVILVIVGAATVIGVTIAAIIETKRVDTDKPEMTQSVERPSEKKKG